MNLDFDNFGFGSSEDKQLSKEQITKILEIALTLEYYGIHIEDTKEQNDKYGITNKLIYYFSVPEYSILENKNVDKEFNEKLKTSEGLIFIAKEAFKEMIIDSYKNTFGEDDWLLEDLKNDINDLLKFYAKVRKDEVWNEEKGKAAVKKIVDELEEAIKYKEV